MSWQRILIFLLEIANYTWNSGYKKTMQKVKKNNKKLARKASIWKVEMTIIVNNLFLKRVFIWRIEVFLAKNIDLLSISDCNLANILDSLWFRFHLPEVNDLEYFVCCRKINNTIRSIFCRQLLEEVFIDLFFKMRVCIYFTF